jgi:hypothetical protein
MPWVSTPYASVKRAVMSRLKSKSVTEIIMSDIDRQIVTLTFCARPARAMRQSTIFRLGGACLRASRANFVQETTCSSAGMKCLPTLDEDPSIAIEFRAPISEQLRQLCSNIIAAFDRSLLVVRLVLVIDGNCPVEHEKAVLVAAAEMIANSIEHGFYERVMGRIGIRITSEEEIGTRIEVSDDGWGFDITTIREGSGMRLLRRLGSVSLSDRPGEAGMRMTSVSLLLPPLG